MKQLKLKKLLIAALACASLLALNPISAHAEWIRDSTGWWNSEGDSWSIGWKNIDEIWYYFDSNGYMKTGWLFDSDKWYYLNKNGSMMNTGWFSYNNDWYYLYSDGSMAVNVIIDGYKFNLDGKWDKVVPKDNSNNTNVKLNITGSKEDEKTANNYLRDQGYEIISSKGAVDKYVLSKDMLYGGIDSTLYSCIWGEQKLNPDDYLGKEITTYTFLVKNHPLEKTYHANTFVSVMMYNGKVIGGYSNPDADLVGSSYSLDGKTLEEVTGMTYLEWGDKWSEKYGPYKQAFLNSLKNEGFIFEVKNAEKNLLSGECQIVTFPYLNNEVLTIYKYDSKADLEKDSSEIEPDGFMYKGRYLHWDSYPHFYKKNNLIIQYIGKTYTIISSLDSICDEQFAGLKHSKNLSSSADVRKTVYDQMNSKTKESLKGGWQDFDIRTITLDEGMGDINDKSYIGKDVYLIDYTTNSSSEPNDIGLYVTMDTFKILGHGYSD